MPLVARCLRRLRLLLRLRDVERAMDDEMQYHIERETADRVAAGMTPEAARRAALRDFGGIERFKEEGRDARGTRALEDLGRDLQYAARVLRRNPGFTVAIVLTFALGIGTTTAIYSAVYGVLLRPLPYADPDRLVALWERNVPRNRDRNVVSMDNFLAWRERTTSFSGMAALVPRPVTLAGKSGPERLAGAEVSPGFFTLLGVRPALGRDLSTGETDAVVLSDGLWRRRFGADPGIVGRSLTLSDISFTVVGVMPAGFEPPKFDWLGHQDLWVPLPEQGRSWGRFLLVVARLKPGATIDAARDELESVASALERESPANKGWSATIVGLQEQISGGARTSLLAVLTAVAVLLVLAVANVAMLTLSLMRRRQHELQIRRAIGATDGRLFRQLFAQSALLGIIGTAIGLAVAVPGLRLLIALMPPDVPRLASIQLDGPVLSAAVLIAAAATFIFGTAGARSAAAATDTRAALRVAPRAGGGALVITEIALALALGVMAVLMVRSFMALRAVDLGFDPNGVVAARVAISARYEGRERVFFDTLLDRLRALPGVRSAAIVNARPFSALRVAPNVHDPARPAGASDALVADARYCDAAFFSTLRIPFVAGEPFANSTEAPPAVVVNEALVRALWNGERAIGRRLHVGLFNGINAEVVGVVRDVHLRDSRTPPRATVYLSAARYSMEVNDVMVRVDGDAATIVPSLRSALASVDPNVPLYQVDTMSALAEETLATDRFAAFMLGSLAAAALLLATVGIFGVFIGDVSARRREIGIRVALGSSTRAVLAVFLRRAAKLSAGGVAAGAVLAFVLATTIQSLLFGVSPEDPPTFIATASVTLGVAAAGTLLPAWRALRRSPIAALREE